MRGFEKPPQPTQQMLEERERLLAAAATNEQCAADSFERCDTDGFLSQWASRVTADRIRLQADILANGGCALFPVLYDKVTDKVVATEVFEFQNQHAPWRTERRWRLEDYDVIQRAGRKWVPVGATSRVQKANSFEEQKRWFPAVAVLRGSTATSVEPVAERLGNNDQP